MTNPSWDAHQEKMRAEVDEYLAAWNRESSEQTYAPPKDTTRPPLPGSADFPCDAGLSGGSERLSRTSKEHP